MAKSALKKKPKPVVIVCTGYATIDNSKAVLKMGVDYMAHKPVDEKVTALFLERGNNDG